MDRLNFLLTEYKSACAGTFVATGDNRSVTPLTLIAAVAGQTLFVTKVTFMFDTSDRTKTWRLIGSTATVSIAVAKATYDPAAGANVPGPVVFDFGEDGLELTEGDALYYKNSAAGASGAIFVQAYRRVPATT